MTQNLTDKNDVYSFGAVLLELLTTEGKPPIHQGRSFVVREFRNALDRGGTEAVRLLMDPALQDIPSGKLEPYLKIALACVEEEENGRRPTTAEIVQQLQALDLFSKTKPKGGPARGMDRDVEGEDKKVKLLANELMNESERTDRNGARVLESSEMAPESSLHVVYSYERSSDSE